MKPAAPISEEEKRERSRQEDLKGAKELQKTLLRLTRKLGKLTIDQILDKLAIKSAGPLGVTTVAYSGAFIKDLATSLEKIQRVSLLALQDSPAERARRDPQSANKDVWEAHKEAIDFEIELLMKKHPTEGDCPRPAIEAEIVQSSPAASEPPAALTDTPLPIKTKLVFDPDKLT